MWKTIENFENYEVSDLGQVRNKKTGRILKPNLVGKGYYKIDLHKNSKRYCFLIHRLVAQAFIENPNNLPQVNHIDEDKENNNVSNLEWCDANYNNKYGTRTQRAILSHNKAILQYSLDGKLIKEWSSIKDAGDTLHIDRGDISKCCNGKQHTAGNYKWKFKNE